MPEPKRRENRKTHLDASVVPVERALLARAEALEDGSRQTDGGNVSYLFVAVEFRKLAEELHWWG
jgi:hypothetical protein